jgi:hypothetical protein
MVKRALLVVLLAAAAISISQAETPELKDSLAVPAGTLLHCRTTQTLTTKLNAAGDGFTFTVTEPVMMNGHAAIPVGSTLAGRIAMIERPGRIKGVGQMRLRVDNIALPNGRTFPLGASLMTAYGVNNVKVVGSEGLVKGPSSRGADLKEIGAGTAGGAILGLIFAHPLVGATVGAAATTVDRMRRRGKDLTLPVGTDLNYQLTRELAIDGNATQTSASILDHGAGK